MSDKSKIWTKVGATILSLQSIDGISYTRLDFKDISFSFFWKITKSVVRHRKNLKVKLNVTFYLKKIFNDNFLEKEKKKWLSTTFVQDGH